MNPSRSPGYIDLLRSNPAFRRLWYGQVVSELGDWLNSIAIYALILKLGGAGMALATAMMAKLLPLVVVSPLAGVVVDRVNRKTVMIVSDLLRFLVVLGFLGIQETDDMVLLYTLVVIEVALSGFFEPARSAIIPSITSRKDLVTANALSGSTWSVMLAFGAALGGVLVALVGIRMAFIIDALTFLLSAWFIFRVPFVPAKKDLTESVGRTGFRDLAAGFRYLKSEPVVLVLSLLKSGLAVSGGIMTLIPLYAYQLFPSPAAVSLGIGWMYSARGIGAALGPVLVKRFFGDSARVLQRAIAAAFFLGAGAYLWFAHSYTLVSASLSIGLATFSGSIVWVFSSALIHMEAKEKFMGRVFSSELAVMTLVMAISNFSVGFATGRLGFSPNDAALGLAGLYLAPGLGWILFLVFLHNRMKQGKCVGSVCPVDPSGFNPAPTVSLDKK